MKRMIVLSMVCALAGVGVAVAQQTGNADNSEGQHCDHHRGHGRGPGKMLRKMDANNDGRITRAEFNAGHEEHFKRMDKNNDGVITQEELQQLRAEHGHRGPRGEHGGRGQRGAAGTGG